jgi:subtilisin family serine protease
MGKYLLLLIFSYYVNFLFSQKEMELSQVVRLNPVFLDEAKINDHSLIRGELKEFCNHKGLRQLDSLEKLFVNTLTNIDVEKLFLFLSTIDTISIGRQGQKVPIPPFWATFCFNFASENQNFEYLKILKRCYPLVIYNHPFFEIEFQSQVNDPYFDNQLGFKNINAPDADINMEEAWEISSGKSFIKVGVFDSGIDAHHEDLAVLTGCPCYENTGLINYSFGYDKLGHGTSVAGIIGAKNNNSLGIAGVAGGGINDELGVSLLDFKLTDSLGTFSRLGVGIGLIDASRKVGTYYNWSILDPLNEIDFVSNLNPGYGINIANHSYNLKVYPFTRPLGGGAVGDSIFIEDVDAPIFSECYLCREAFLFSLKNGVVNVVARGNRANPNFPPEGYPKVPSIYDDSWIISVGSSDKNGGFINSTEATENGYVSYIGKSVDLIAPGTKSTVFTTKSTHLNNTSHYRNFNGTSAAAPHVSGVAALLLSKYNKPCYSNINLDPADVEYILQKSAKDVGALLYDAPTGWGLLDAKKALDMINYPMLQIVHPISDPINFDIISIDTIHFYLNTPIYNNYGGPIGQFFEPAINNNYKAIRYKIDLSYDFSNYMAPNTQLLDAWIRYSQTNSGILINDTSYSLGYLGMTGQLTNILNVDTFQVEPYAYIQNVDAINNKITIRGYYYNFISRMDQFLLNEEDSLNFWYPVNPYAIMPKMSYSIYIMDSTLDSRYDFPCDSTNQLVDTTLHLNTYKGERLLIYPNPSKDQLTIDGIDANATGIINVFNMNMQLIHKEIINTNTKSRTLNLTDLPSGIYLIEYKTEDFQIMKKWVKL